MAVKIHSEIFASQSNDPEHNRRAVAAVHETLATQGAAAVPDTVWRHYLRWSARPEVLESLDVATRYQWAVDAVALLAHLRYSLGDLLADRAEECGDAVYLESLAEGRKLTFDEARQRIRRIASALHAVHSTPRVLIFAANSIETALCDLACLCRGMLVAPVSVHTDVQELAWMMARLGINIAVTDAPERLTMLASAAATMKRPPSIIVTQKDIEDKHRDILLLDDIIAEFGHRPLPEHPVDPFSTATVMFTSGSTGRPKAVCFSQHAMVAKRFARAAALPSVGRRETLLAYLPLFHTFGRFLELQGMLFWRGRYVFAQDGSREALLSGLRAVQPTGLIGIPLRWSQLRDAAVANMNGLGGSEARDAFREVCGQSLRWGLSAAGHLDANVFRFFQDLGVELCSGFGMTEATGGILMSPPGAYEAGTVGVPLPCVDARISDEGELLIRGPYVARILGEGGDLPMAHPGDHPWFATGDVFVRHASGNYEIVDRLKDIYKNSRGQTVSPLGIETRLRGIPGFRRVFVVGDGREYNVLLVVPDTAHHLFSAGHTEEERDAYIREIIRTVNAQLAPFERIVRYALLDRDFDAELGELTPKGSFNRGAVARSFAGVIASLYKSRSLDFVHDGLTLRLPHWLLRELGVTEHDITSGGDGLGNRAEGTLLNVARGRDAQSWIVGDLEYCIPGGVLDLGVLCRQPLGWIANPALVAMFPCREGWDASLPAGMSVRASANGASRTLAASGGAAPSGVSIRLHRIHALLSAVLLGDAATAMTLIDDVAVELDHGGRHLGGVIRARLASLAWHPDAGVRCSAYAALLLYDPMPEESAAYAEFVRSGLPFLSSESIRGIAGRDLRHGRLAALRARLQRYRDEKVFDGPEGTVVVRAVLELLTHLAETDPVYVYEVRAELCHWMRHEFERGLRQYGSDTLFQRLKAQYVSRYAAWLQGGSSGDCLRSALRYDQSIPDDSRLRLEALFTSTPFLPLSLLMLYEIPSFSCERVAADGVWISMLPGFGGAPRFLASISTRDGRHYQMQILLHPEFSDPDVLGSMHAFIALAGAASGARVLPRFGSFMPDAGAVSMQYVRGTTVWDDILRLASRRDHPAEATRKLRSLFVRGMAAFITAWRQSSGSIIPGAAHPANVSVPDECVRGGAMIHSIDGWKPCDGPASLLQSLRHHFYAMTSAHIPELRGSLDAVWICEAAREALGDAEGMSMIEAMLAEGNEVDEDLRSAASRWLDAMRAGWIAPLSLDSAVACFCEWNSSHATPPFALRERYTRDLARLFDIGRLGEIGRYTLYRRTAFADARDETLRAFDSLLDDMHRYPAVPPTRLPAMTALQDSLQAEDERHALLRMVSPSADASRYALMTVEGVQVLQRRIPGRTGETFILRDAVTAAEIGMLYDLFLREQFPVVIGEGMQYLVLVDEWHRIEGGAGYAFEADGSLSVELLIIDPAVRGKGLGAAIIDELGRRASDMGALQLRAPYYLRKFCLRMGFADDAGNGDLRRAVAPQPGNTVTL
ncbi:MAG: AMP-binding protein [Bacteroidia bacterium]|nr:AMP-binding protein [Bacteroidia bacterium]